MEILIFVTGLLVIVMVILFLDESDIDRKIYYTVCSCFIISIIVVALLYQQPIKTEMIEEYKSNKIKLPNDCIIKLNEICDIKIYKTYRPWLINCNNYYEVFYLNENTKE